MYKSIQAVLLIIKNETIVLHPSVFICYLQKYIRKYLSLIIYNLPLNFYPLTFTLNHSLKYKQSLIFNFFREFKQ